VKDKMDGELVERGGLTFDKEGKYRTPPAEILKKFIQSKLAPVPGVVASTPLVFGTRMERFSEDTEIDGVKYRAGQPKPFTALGAVEDLVEPMAEADLREAFELEGTEGLLKALPTIVGIGTQTYKARPKKAPKAPKLVTPMTKMPSLKSLR